jgi:hypothetical protein
VSERARTVASGLDELEALVALAVTFTVLGSVSVSF